MLTETWRIKIVDGLFSKILEHQDQNFSVMLQTHYVYWCKHYPCLPYFGKEPPKNWTKNIFKTLARCLGKKSLYTPLWKRFFMFYLRSIFAIEDYPKTFWSNLNHSYL
jgi:hypothetical protein